jgi:hypothetical protein
MILLQQPYLTIETLNDNRVLLNEWRGEVSLNDFQRAIDNIVHYTERLQPRYVIVDTRKQAVLSKEATDYAVSKQMALTNVIMIFVLPDSVYTKMSVDMFNEEMAAKQSKHHIRYFQSVEAAHHWIQSRES